MYPRVNRLSQRLFRTMVRRSQLKPRQMNRVIRNNPFYLSPFRSQRLFSVTTVNVPNMGDSITEGTLVEWTKNVGDLCQVDDVVAVIETDKGSIDIRTDFAGVTTDQLAAIDDTLEVSAPLFKIDTSKSDAAAPSDSTTPPPAAAAS